MKIHQNTRKYFAIFGIFLAELNQERSPNIRNAIALLTLIFSNVSSCAFILYESDNFGENVNAIYIVLSTINLSINTMVQIANTTQLFQFILHFEDFIEES